MTVICALHDPVESCTWIAGDSRTTFGGLAFDHQRKWQQIDAAAWIGHCGTSRSAHLVRRHRAAFAGLDAYAVADTLKQMTADDGWVAKTEAGAPTYYEASFVYATAAGVWGICGNFAVIDVPPGVLWADGCGENFARGAAWALQDIGVVDARHLVAAGVRAAITYDTRCGGTPFIHCVR